MLRGAVPRRGAAPPRRRPRRSRPRSAPSSRRSPRPRRRKTIVDAEAEAEKRRIEAEGEAAAIFAKLEAEARGQYEILAKKGEGLKQIIEGCGGAQPAFQMLMLEHLDTSPRPRRKAISNIKFDKVVVWDGGGGRRQRRRRAGLPAEPRRHAAADAADHEGHRRRRDARVLRQARARPTPRSARATRPPAARRPHRSREGLGTPGRRRFLDAHDPLGAAPLTSDQEIDPETGLPIGVRVDATPARRPGPVLIEGRGVRLEPLEGRHARELFEASLAPGAAVRFRYLWDEPPRDVADVERWIAAAKSDAERVAWALVENGTGRVEGRFCLMRIAPEQRRIELGHVLFGPRLSRTRAATEAVYLIARHAFEELGYRRFEWKCDALNAPSRRAALRYGFAFEGIFRRDMIIKGRNARHGLVRAHRRRLAARASGLRALARPGQLRRRGAPAAHARGAARVKRALRRWTRPAPAVRGGGGDGPPARSSRGHGELEGVREARRLVARVRRVAVPELRLNDGSCTRIVVGLRTGRARAP